MKEEDLKKITLETPIYHPLFGEGHPIKITLNRLTVRFKDCVEVEFGTSGVVSKDHFLKDIFLKPVKIIEDN